MNQSSPSRRRFLIDTAVAVTALPLGAQLLGRNAWAQDLPMLPLDNAQAKALNYVESTDGLSHPSFKPGSDCAGCQFYTNASAAEAGPCTLFPGHKVAAKGWCSAWAKRA